MIQIAFDHPRNLGVNRKSELIAIEVQLHIYEHDAFF